MRERFTSILIPDPHRLFMHSKTVLLAAFSALLLACSTVQARAESEHQNDSAQSQGILRLVEGEFVLDEAASPPGEDAPWRSIRLPDEWNENHPVDEETGWYRFAPAPIETKGPLAVLIPRVNMSASVWIDSQKLAGLESRTELPNDFNRPLLFRAAQQISTTDIRWIYVRLKRHAYHQGSLGPVEVGALNTLSARHATDLLYRIDLARIATILVVVAALFAGALWFATKREPLYGYFAITAACCAFASLNYWLRELPVDRWVWERLVHGALIGFTIGMGLWSRRLVSIEPSRFDRALQLYLVVALGILAWLPVEHFYPNVLILQALPALIPVYAATLVFRFSHLMTPAERFIYAVGAVIAISFGFHDLLLQFGLLPSGRRHLLTYAMPIVVIIFAGSLVARFSASLEGVKRLNDDLEKRVEEKAAELSANYEQMRKLERDQVLLLERERLTREMHDGLGGQLVSALALAEGSEMQSPTVASSLRTALADLRTVINSLDPRIADFGTLFGLLRTRIEPLFESSEIDIAWRVGDLPADSHLGPEQNLHLLRILQEAFTNAVRHSGASQIEFATDWSSDALTLRVEDDGEGLAEDHSPGRGLANMRNRAESMGGELKIENTGGGTRLELRLPLRMSS
ncbi:MAG: ATP-binding protein [Myxococcota bacterium]